MSSDRPDNDDLIEQDPSPSSSAHNVTDHAQPGSGEQIRDASTLQDAIEGEQCEEDTRQCEPQPLRAPPSDVHSKSLIESPIIEARTPIPSASYNDRTFEESEQNVPLQSNDNHLLPVNIEIEQYDPTSTDVQGKEIDVKSMLLQQVSEDIQHLPHLFRSIIKGAQRFMTVATFTGLILLYGSAPLSCRQYLLVTTLLGYFMRALYDPQNDSCKERPPRFSCGLTKVRQRVFPQLVDHLLPKSIILSFQAGKQSIKPSESWVEEPCSWCDEDHLKIGAVSEMIQGVDGPDAVADESESNCNLGVDGPDAIADESESNCNLPNADEVASDAVPCEMKDCLIVRPSEWSRYDLLNPKFLDVIKQKQEEISQVKSTLQQWHPRSFSRSTLITNPEAVYDRDTKLWVLNQSTGILQAGNVGDRIKICSVLSTSDSSFLETIRSSGWHCSDNLSYVNAKIAAVWNAGSKSIDARVNEGAGAGSKRTQPSILTPLRSELDSGLQQVISYVEDNLCHPSTLAESVKAYNKDISKRSTRGLTRPDPKHLHALLPGDTCTILEGTLEASGSNGDRVVAVLVDRFVRSKNWPSTKFILWFRLLRTEDTPPNDNSADTTASISKMFLVTKSTGQPELLQRSDTARDNLRFNQNITGTLESGERYYVYRFMLYSDDFGPRSTIFPRGSVGGVYLRPVDLPVNLLRSPQCIHPVSLAPTGVNSNVVINNVVQDIVHCSYNGFTSLDADGTPCRVFLQMVGYVGDYPESSAVIDIMKHSARAPCTLCNFRYKRTEFGKSYCYSTTSVSLNSSFTRGWFRTKAIRYSGLLKKDLKWMGMNYGDIDEMFASVDEHWVLLKLADAFDHNRQLGKISPRTLDGLQVVSCRFDPYLQNAVAPDHCITGIVKSILKVCFDCLSSKNQTILDNALVSSITKMGVAGQTTLYNQKTKSLNGLPMSTLFAIQTLLPSVLLSCGLSKNVDCFSIITSFTSLITLLYWWPSFDDSDMNSFGYLHSSNDYYVDLQSYLLKFIGDLQTYYVINGANASSIDSPNVHRLMELVLNTVPTYGHVLLIAELPFEAFHQSLKRTLSKNTTKKSHITAMRCVLFGDWFRRVATAMTTLARDRSSHKKLI